MDTCSICLENLDEEQSFSLETCGHTFHTKCIINWFRSSSSCPCCRNTSTTSQIPSFYLNERYRELKRVARLKNAPKDLKKLVEREKDIDEKLKIANKNYVEFRKENKEFFKDEKNLKKSKWRLYSQKREISNRIGVYQSNEYVLPNLTIISPNF